MVSSDYKNCVVCGASFKKSRTDSTVKCPDCRHGKRHTDDVCIVCQGERYISNRHADGSVTRDPCYRCNR